MPLIEVKDVQDLQIGVFVKLEGSWFSHPFPTNTFTIKSAEDLATIQGLSHVIILYDPDRSHSVDSEHDQTNGEELPGLPTESEDSETLETSSIEDKGHLQEEESLISEAALSELLGRREDDHEFYDHLQKVEGAYKETLSQGQELFQQLSGRRPAGLKTGDAMITGMMQSLNNPKTAMSLIDLVGSNGVTWGLSEHAVQALVQAIGVYPPGSLVELTDGFTGVVSSINVHHPTKPIVLLYAPWLCRNDGLLVNLAKEHTLQIKQAVHAKDVPEQVLAYLSPRRMSMFIHAEPISMGFNSRPSRQKKRVGTF